MLPGKRILFLHHSTGRLIWNGGQLKLFPRIARKLFSLIRVKSNPFARVPSLVWQHNRASGTKHLVEELTFPKASPYGWRNYPFDYYNIWVKHAGPSPTLGEPTLEMLTPHYDVIVFKHCFPVSAIQADTHPEIDSEYRSLANYKLQYRALRDKLRQFSSTQFIIWTNPALVKSRTTEEEARRGQEFARWVVEEWDAPDDNIFLWDFHGLETEGDLYLQEKFAQSATDSHPNQRFCTEASRLFVQRVLDVAQSNGRHTDLQGLHSAGSTTP
ncbi:MAG TPA: hypothetical protein VFE51_00290 [Verrucomicrobiae bacterium]|nr:hypothetical protein [Verrucomicrobiae bacterium]